MDRVTEPITLDTPISALTQAELSELVAEVLRQTVAEGEKGVWQEYEALCQAFRRQHLDTAFWVQDAFVGHPEWGDSVLVGQDGLNGRLFMVPYTQEDNEYTFGALPEWVEVVMEKVYRRKEAVLEPPEETVPELPEEPKLPEETELPEETVQAERDIPAEELEDAEESDFAGKNRSFPILKPEDVAAAASSLGRAGKDNYSTETIKANIIKIAKRKGEAFVAQLPEAWKEEEGLIEEISWLAEVGEDCDLQSQAQIVEVRDRGDGNRRGPVSMVIEPIAPGWGNAKDKHYYPRELLTERAGVFVGSRMFLTDHKDGERNARNFASVVERHVGFGEQGAPRYEVTVLNPDTCELVRNCAETDHLDQLQFSIFAKGTHKKGKVDGREGWIVTEIADNPKPYIDWVSAAGAGGKAVALAEVLPREKVREVLTSRKVDAVMMERLAEMDYQTEEEVEAAITKEKDYVKRLTGSGQPRISESAVPTRAGVSLEERERRFAAIDSRYGLTTQNRGD